MNIFIDSSNEASFLMERIKVVKSNGRFVAVMVGKFHNKGEWNETDKVL